MTLTIDTKNKTIIIHGNVNVGDLLQAISGLENMEEYSIGMFESEITKADDDPIKAAGRQMRCPYPPIQYTRNPLGPPFIITCGKTDNQPCK